MDTLYYMFILAMYIIYTYEYIPFIKISCKQVIRYILAKMKNRYIYRGCCGMVCGSVCCLLIR